MIILGIDPGVTGAIANLGHRGELLKLADLPTMQRAGAKAHVQRQVNGAGLAELLCEWLREFDKNEIRIFLETPIAFPGQHVAAIGAAFHTVGIIEGVVTAKHYALELVQPHIWKKVMGLSKSKEQCRAKAVRMFPEASLHRVKDHNRAEALLIARYGHDKVA